MARSVLAPLFPLSDMSHQFQSADTSAHSKTWRSFVVSLALFSIALTARAQNYSIDWFKIAGGGGTSTGGTYQVSGTIGQPEAGVAMSGGYYYSAIGGFWSLIAVVQTPGPILTITFVGPDSVVVSWPSSATNYVLQQNSDLTTTNWSDFGGTVSDDGTNKSVTLTLPTGYLFFRLNHP